MKFGTLNIHNVDLRMTAGFASQLIKSGLPQVAFAGRSNVGKSSLINSLLGRKKLARVSGEPGKTITANFYEVDKQLTLVDLPGYGFAKRSKAEKEKWSALTEGYFESNPMLRLVLQLIGIRIGITDDDMMMLSYLEHYRIPYIIVATKCDKLNKTKLNQACKSLLEENELESNTKIILYSSITHAGRDLLWNQITESCVGGTDA